MNSIIKIVTINVIALVLLVQGTAYSQEMYPDKQLTNEQQEQIMLLRTELEFLASKLLKLTNKTEYSLSHPGHVLIHFGVCGDGTKKGIKIKCVSPFTAAYNIGIKSGDTLIEINQVKLTNLQPDVAYKKYSNIVKKLVDGDDITVTFQQNGEIKTGKGVIKNIFAPGYLFTVNSQVEY